jgi:hypothetical protein
MTGRGKEGGGEGFICLECFHGFVVFACIQQLDGVDGGVWGGMPKAYV